VAEAPHDLSQPQQPRSQQVARRGGSLSPLEQTEPCSIEQIFATVARPRHERAAPGAWFAPQQPDLIPQLGQLA
jgi:hypothetical protein